MYTKNDENFGRQLTLNYKNYTDFYTGHCNEIKGSATEFYPLHIKQTKLVFYSSELCRYAELEFVREEFIKGVLGYRFSADNIFDNGKNMSLLLSSNIMLLIMSKIDVKHTNHFILTIL